MKRILTAWMLFPLISACSAETQGTNDGAKTSSFFPFVTLDMSFSAFSRLDKPPEQFSENHIA
ncbi:hypothetical protein DV712_19955 (plasmid) [Parageobacillus thermoglucosidasius]|nr:hypothetical protein [Parageobacillus thermoglucosidasius]RDE18608.1 hypothetical protein DV712_19955 [Parageobacillus thermoglucosidasius]